VGDIALADDHSINQHNRDAPVVQAKQLFVGVDIGEVGFVAELAE
jgi:hypothetical protein